MSDISEIKAYMRDINLDILMNCPDVEIDISKRYENKFRWFYPNRKLIRYVTEIGGILTGSRAIRCYTINGKPLLERRVSDWDFIVTLDMAFRICDEMGIEEIPHLGGTLSIKNQRMWRHPDYSDSYRVGPVDVQLIVKDELPDHKTIDGIRIADFGYSVSQKIGLSMELQGKLTNNNGEITEQYHKHIDDLKEMIIKFNSLKYKTK